MTDHINDVFEQALEEGPELANPSHSSATSASTSVAGKKKSKSRKLSDTA
jgi:hypothetical protein